MKRQRSTKKALLSSILSLIICLTMLIGTTFAWFTDSVTSANNIIKSGNLDVELEYWTGKEWKDVKDASDILSGDLWEPGYADVAYLKLKNAGSLALKYHLGVNIVSETAGVNAAGNEFKLSDYIYFDVVQGVNGETNAYATREAAMEVATETTKISKGYTKVGHLEAESDPVYLALVVHMPTTVGNEANHNGTDVPQIDLGINVFATQYTSESDSFGIDYDDLAFVPVADVDVLDDTMITLVDDTQMDLDAAFSFKTTEDDVAAAASGYRYWHADFVVSASHTVKANSVALAGYYDAYAQATNTVGKWIALVSDEDVAANTEIRLMELMGVVGNYEELCTWIPEFLCGVKDLDGSNEGKTLTVELRLYETYSEEECLELFGYKSKNEETGDYITVGVFDHTFGGEYETLADGAVLFNKNDGEVVLYSATDVTTADYVVPEGVTTIGGYSFDYNDDINTITLPDTVTTLNDRAFRGTSASTVVLNEGLTNISYQAFRDATNVKSIEIPSTVTTIADSAFQMSGITELTIPATVETIEYGACRDMEELTTVTIEGDHVEIPKFAFRDCKKLTTVYLKVNSVTLGDGMIFTNDESNNADPNNITIYVYNDEVYNTLISNSNVKCTIVKNSGQ